MNTPFECHSGYPPILSPQSPFLNSQGLYAPVVSQRSNRLTNSLTVRPLREFVRAVATSTQTHDDFVLMHVLGAISTAVNGKLRVVRRQHEEAVQLYLMPIAEPGERKSAVVNLVRRPILDASALSSERRIYIDDITPTALKQALAKAKGRLAAHTAEGSTLMASMSKRGFAKGVFCAAYDGEEIHLDRTGKEPLEFPDAALTLCLSCQPSVALDFARTRDVDEQGLLGRFLMAFFPRMAGSRTVHTERVADSTINAYSNTIHRLFEIDSPSPGQRHMLILTSNAEARFTMFHEQTERELRTGGLLSFDLAWGAKLHGKVLRIAALLHCVTEESPLKTPIGQESIEQAIQMADEFTVYSREFYTNVRDRIGEHTGQVLSLIWEWAMRQKPWPHESITGEFSVKDIRSHLTTLSRRQIDAAIERLLQMRRITEFLPAYAAQCGAPHPGRRRMPKYIINFESQLHFIQPLSIHGGGNK